MLKLTVSISKFLLTVAALFPFSACNKEIAPFEQQEEQPVLATKSVSPEYFDWETVDWMPTPVGQTQISVPWEGQGSLVGAYAYSAVMDYKKSDGWRLLYSTFRSSGTEPIVNPYFVLYNVYRGLMRIYFYVTESYLVPSSYIQDYISIESSGTTSDLFDFLTGDWIDTVYDKRSFSQIQPKPLHGGAPFASNRWYMFEYELAYDPDTESMSNLRLAWRVDFTNVDSLVFSGTGVSDVNGLIGSGSKTSTNPMKSIVSDIDDAATIGGTFTAFGVDFLATMLKNETTYENRIGLSPTLFKRIYNSAIEAADVFSGGIVSSTVDFLNAVIGGSSTTSTTPITLKASTDFRFAGTTENNYSFPSMPISWLIPGTIIPSTYQSYIPLSDDPLGVFNWTGRAYYQTQEGYDVVEDPSGYGTYKEYYGHIEFAWSYDDLLDGLVINPAVEEVADVSVAEAVFFVMIGDDIIIEPQDLEYSWSDNPYVGGESMPSSFTCGLKLVIHVDPKDQSVPDSYIYKTFAVPTN